MSGKFSTNIIVVLAVILNYSNAYAQDRALGTWKSFVPYSNSLGVFDAGSKVFNVSENGIFWYDKNTGEVQTYNKASGLSDVGIKTANYDAANDVLVIAYINNNLDLIYRGTDIYNIPDIRKESSSGAFTINSISFNGGNAYISSDLGISVINLAKKEISNTYIIGSAGLQTKVFATTMDATTLYAASSEGVKHAPINANNLQDFNSWTLYENADGLPTKKSKFICAYNSKVYAVISGTAGDSLFVYNAGTWLPLYAVAGYIFTSLNVVNNTLYFTTNNASASGYNGKIDLAGTLTQNLAQHARPYGWFESNGLAWEADLWNGLFRNNQGTIENIVPNGPQSTFASDLSIANNTLFVASGGADESWGPLYLPYGFYSYKNSNWANYNQYNIPELANMLGIVSTATIPQLNKAYFSSNTSKVHAIAELDLTTNNITYYDSSNTNGVIEYTFGAGGDQRVSAMSADKYGNLWVANSGATKPMKVLKSNGTWNQYVIPYNFGLMKKMVIDQNDQIWAPLRTTTSGLLVWSYNGTLDDPSDDKSRILYSGSGAGGLPDAIVHSVAEDKEGNVWVGTEQGIGIFYCASSVLSSTARCDADQIKVERDGYIGYLFGTESVRCIAVDAANRKWIGTTNGLWLISEDGKTELLKFNTDNSPLPDNQIADIILDDATGEVFIATIKGIVSYQGDAVAGCADCETALVYPNPVKPDYNGPIAIKGLVENAYVKITDVAGTLVYQGRANGAQMIWDGKGYKGERASSGVYLVFSSTDGGKEKRVAKILLMN